MPSFAPKIRVEVYVPIRYEPTYQDTLTWLIEEFTELLLFHESVGSRLLGIAPQSFVDINALRTDLRHDVDHGKKGKVKSKRMRIASAFRRYSGINSPGGMAPERFVVFQANLLSAIKLELAQLKP